jgi:integrase
MGTIHERKRADGTIAYSAQILIMRDRQIAHRESRTFNDRAMAKGWIKTREKELAKPGALPAGPAASETLGDAIEKVIATSQKQMGRTKAHALGALQKTKAAKLRCDKIGSKELVALAEELLNGARQPQTVASYMATLQGVFAIARPAWGFALDPQAIKDALKVCRRLGLTSSSKKRDRRPTLYELDKLMEHFAGVEVRMPKSTPMCKIIAFAIYSTRRQEEITTIAWRDLEPGRVMVRNMKHPGAKAGNDTWCDLVPEAERIIESMPKVKPRIFPVSPNSISLAFTRACKLLGIEDLHFHDLRHEGISRLFEMGYGDIPHVAKVSGHRSWDSLQRYTQIRQRGDKFANWKWLEAITGD